MGRGRRIWVEIEDIGLMFIRSEMDEAREGFIVWKQVVVDF